MESGVLTEAYTAGVDESTSTGTAFCLVVIGKANAAPVWRIVGKRKRHVLALATKFAPTGFTHLNDSFLAFAAKAFALLAVEGLAKT